MLEKLINKAEESMEKALQNARKTKVLREIKRKQVN